MRHTCTNSTVCVHWSRWAPHVIDYNCSAIYGTIQRNTYRERFWRFKAVYVTCSLRLYFATNFPSSPLSSKTQSYANNTVCAYIWSRLPARRALAIIPLLLKAQLREASTIKTHGKGIQRINATFATCFPLCIYCRWRTSFRRSGGCWCYVRATNPTATSTNTTKDMWVLALERACMWMSIGVRASLSAWTWKCIALSFVPQNTLNDEISMNEFCSIVCPTEHSKRQDKYGWVWALERAWTRIALLYAAHNTMGRGMGSDGRVCANGMGLDVRIGRHALLILWSAPRTVPSEH